MVFKSSEFASALHQLVSLSST